MEIIDFKMADWEMQRRPIQIRSEAEERNLRETWHSPYSGHERVPLLGAK